MLALLIAFSNSLWWIGKQSMNLVVRFVADSVNLRSKLLREAVRILSSSF